MKKSICCLLLICFSVLGYSQKLTGSFPYEMVGDKMIVNVKINGIEKRFVFDTGARLCSVSREVVRELGLQDTLVQQVVDANNHQTESRMVILDNVEFSGMVMNFQGFRALVMENNIFECFGADGLIGSELLAQTILEINGAEKKITLTSAERAPKVSLRESCNFVKSGVMPIVETLWDNMSVPVLFDSGFGGFLKMRPEDYEACSSVLEVLAEGTQEGSISIGGKAENRLSRRVKISSFRICMATFTDAVVETASAPYSLLGMKLLDYGKVTIDYPRMRFYYEPYGRDVKLEAPLNDYTLKVSSKGDIVVAGVWSTETSGIQPGDEVLKINGKPAGTYDFCESITTGLKDLQQRSKNVLEIKTADGIKKVVYKYNKKKGKK